MPNDVTKKEKKEKKHFFKDFKAELKKVIWPTPKQLINSTMAVITIVLITAVIVFVLDLVFKAMDDYGINKLRDAIVNRNEQVNMVDTNQVEDGGTNNEETTNSTINNETSNDTVNE